MWRLSPKQREFCFCIFCIEPMSIFLPCYRPAKTNSFLQNGTKYLLIWLFAGRARTHLKTVILITSLTLAPLVMMAGSPFSSACYLSATGMISQSKLFPERSSHHGAHFPHYCRSKGLREAEPQLSTNERAAPLESNQWEARGKW